MSDAALEQAKKAIPAEIRMYSGCRDAQTSAVSFQLKYENRRFDNWR